MLQQLDLRYATTNYCEELTRFNKRLIEDGGCNNSLSYLQLKERMNAFIDSEEYDVLLFVHNEVIIGYALVNKRQNPLFIRHFYIDREYRRKGFGSTAFEKMISLYDTKQFELSVLHTNTIGYMFWQSCGLSPYEYIMRLRKQ